MKKCPYCAESIQDEAVKCRYCGEFLGGAPAGIPDLVRHAGVRVGTVRVGFGYEYKSKITILGLPLVHVAGGVDEKTGRLRVARGVFAFGNIAMGVFAFGAIAMGGFTIGGLSVGVVGLGGMALGGAVIGGMAFGALFAAGGIAVSLGYAVGALALAPCAFGAGSGLFSDTTCFRPLLDFLARWGLKVSGAE